jgi:hypothetical protein
MIYNYSENYVLPFSHDEVVHGKGSLLSRMPGKGQDQFAHLRLMLAYMFTHPGAKLLFMGCEFGQRSEWNFATQLDWDVLGYESHLGIHNWVKTLNRLYTGESALYELCTRPDGFRWMRVDDWQQSILAYERIGEDPDNMVLTILNLTPIDRPDYRIGTHAEGTWTLLHNSDDLQYWGQGREVPATVKTEDTPWEHKPLSMTFVLPGLTALVYKWTPAPRPRRRITARTAKRKQQPEELPVRPVAKRKPARKIEAAPHALPKKKSEKAKSPAGKVPSVPVGPMAVKKKKSASPDEGLKRKAKKPKTLPVLPPPQLARPVKTEAPKKAARKKLPAARTPDRKVAPVPTPSSKTAKSTAVAKGKLPAKKTAARKTSAKALSKTSTMPVKTTKKKK